MHQPLASLTPMQRIRRVRRLVREMQGQRALLTAAPEPRDAVDARERLALRNPHAVALWCDLGRSALGLCHARPHWLWQIA